LANNIWGWGDEAKSTMGISNFTLRRIQVRTTGKIGLNGDF